MHDEVFEVTRTEHHWLATCPCDACRAERERREQSLRVVPPNVAYVLGYISSLTPAGSVARELMLREEHSDQKGEL